MLQRNDTKEKKYARDSILQDVALDVSSWDHVSQHKKRGWEGANSQAADFDSITGGRAWFGNSILRQMKPDQSRLASSTHHLPFLCSIWTNERLISTTSPFHHVTSLKWRYSMMLHLGPFPSSPARPGSKKDATHGRREEAAVELSGDERSNYSHGWKWADCHIQKVHHVFISYDYIVS